MNTLKKIIKFFCFSPIYYYNFLLLNLYKVKYERPIRINGFVKFSNKGRIEFKKNITFNSGKNKNIIGGAIRCNLLVRTGAFLSIGNNCGISNSTFVCTQSIIIEDNVLIGGDCRFYDTDFHSLDFTKRMNPYMNNIPDDLVTQGNILVKEGAWIGGSCIVLKGVTVGAYSIVGAGSVVTKDIPDNELWAGNPIKFIRRLE